MDAILRIADKKGIHDYDLRTENMPVSAFQFTAMKTDKGQWMYYCSSSVRVNGKEAANGILKTGDVIGIDYDTRTTAFVLPIRKTKKFALDKTCTGITIGRKDENVLQLKENQVSGQHCIIHQTETYSYIMDLKSTNGTFVNDKRIIPMKSVLLHDQDVIKISGFTFTMEKNHLVCLHDIAFHPENLDQAESKAKTLFPLKNASTGKSITYAKPHPSPYPWFSTAPRFIGPKPELVINVESAPSLSQKPGMGMMGIGFSIPAMAFGIGMSALNYALKKKKYTKQEKERAEIYARYISGIESQLSEFQKKERAYASSLYPDLKDCFSRLQGPSKNLWERHVEDDDFLSIRFGQGTLPSSAVVNIPQSHLSLTTDEFEHVPSEIKEKYSYIEHMPVTASLKNDGVIGLTGNKKETYTLLRSMVMQIAALQSYEEVKLVLFCKKEDLKEWDWMRWLPHCFNKDRDLRYIFTEDDKQEEILAAEIKTIQDRLNQTSSWGYGNKVSRMPFYVFIVTDASLLENNAIGMALTQNSSDLNVSAIVTGKTSSDFPHSVRCIVNVSGNGSYQNISVQKEKEIKPVTFNTNEAYIDVSLYDDAARKLAPVRLIGAASSSKFTLPNNVSLFEGLGITNKVSINPSQYWKNARAEESMAVPIGIDDHDDPVIFDINEHKHGVHGLVAGASGSGKSKMVQSWIASMAYHFSPEDVNFILVDFKGESLVLPFIKLPHLACYTSNLDPDVRRKFLSIESEMDRRMELLKEYACDDIITYRRKRRNHPSMPNLPFLILVVDEFANFKTEFPEFTEPIDHLYQAGRALGFFGILMTQKPAGKITEQMRANMGFRWCLRVDTTSDSKEVIEIGDAAELKNPGRAYMYTSDKKYVLMQAYYGEMPYDEERLKNHIDSTVYALKLNGTHETYQNLKTDSSLLPTELSVFTEAIAEYCTKNNIPAAKPIWQKELPKKLELEEVLEKYAGREKISPVSVLGLYDDPAHQKQDILAHDLWSDGSFSVYGAPQSGKSQFLETYILSLCEKYTPDSVQFYILECGGFRLEPLLTMPHVGGYASDSDMECMQRILKFLHKELSRRKRIFHQMGIASMEGYYEVKKEYLPTISLIIDNLNTLTQNYSQLTSDIVKLAKEGGSYGILLAVSFAGTYGTYQFTQSIRRVFALRLNDKTDYVSLTGKVSEDVSKMPKGRGFVSESGKALLMQTAVLYVNDSDAKRSVKIHDLSLSKTKQWHGILPETIRSMPEEIFYGDIHGNPYLLGLDFNNVQNVSCNLKEYRSIMISYFKKESNVSLLRSLIRQIQEEQGEIYLYREKHEKYDDLLDASRIITNLTDLDAFLKEMAQMLKKRQQELKQNPSASFTPLVMIVDGLAKIMKEGTVETNQRLEVFVRLGEGIGFMLITADTTDEMNYVKFIGGNILAVTLRKGPKLILGGNINSHQLLSAMDISSTHPQPLKWDEGIYQENENDGNILFKMMQGD